MKVQNVSVMSYESMRNLCATLRYAEMYAAASHNVLKWGK